MPDPRIVVISLDNLGDLVFSSALIAPLRTRFPGATIWVWSKDYGADIAALIPGIDGVFAADPFWDRAPGRGKGSLLKFVRTLGAVRRARCDIALLTSPRWEPAAAATAAGIPVRIGLHGRRNRPWLTVRLPPRDRSKPALAELERLLVPLEARSGPLVCRLDAAALAERRGSFTAELGGRRIAVLHPFAGKLDRCADPAVWEGVAGGLVERGLTPVWFGTAPELAELRRRLGRAAAPDASTGWFYLDRFQAFDLRAGAALMSLAACVAGHDSGPLHIASALGVPTVGVFAPGEPSRTFPQGPAPYRMVVHPSPVTVTAAEILQAIDGLLEPAKP